MPLNRGYTYSTTIDCSGSGMTALRFMTERFPHHTQEGWHQRFLQGEITLENGLIVKPSERVIQGQVLLWHRPPWNEPDVPTNFSVIDQDETFIAVDKPSGLPTLPGAGFLEQTLLHQVQCRFPGVVPMHRLGRGTTGIVLFAKTPQARRFIQCDWQSRRVKKTYLAIVDGIPPNHRQILTPIGPVPHPLLGTVNGASSSGKQAESEMRRLLILNRDTDHPKSLVEVRIATGRPHQIRIHLASIGHPLTGDPLYAPGGIPKENCQAVPGDLGYRLHAWKLTFRHPITGRECPLTSPIPSNWPVTETTLKTL